MDWLIIEFDRALKAILGPAPSSRPVPGDSLPEPDMTNEERARAAALMRVNHCGEVCAQALYQGQALMSRNPIVTRTLQRAREEETEHLGWTAQRISELGGRPSLLNPLWYAGSLAIGMIAGRLGENTNLAFLVETEKQVETHLADHMERLPQSDRKSWAILEQMRQDEISHGDTARRLGGHNLPLPAILGMKLASKVMTTTAYWV